MSFHLGIDAGTSFTAAAIREGGRSSVIGLSERSSALPSAVFLAADGTWFAGDTALRRGVREPSRVAENFKRRFGDSAPLVLGGTPVAADQLWARLIRSIVDRAGTLRADPPDRVAVTHPAGWGSYKLDLLQQAVRLAALNEVTLLTEPEATVLHHSTISPSTPGAVTAVFDVGGASTDATIVASTATGTEIMGLPHGIDRLGGIDFDAAILTFVDARTDGAVTAVDPTTAGARVALARLRSDCVAAKELLSVDDVADIAVLLPTAQTTVTITRADFETAIRPALNQAVGTLEQAIASAGVTVGDLESVLLAGGSARIPLVAELVSERLGREVRRAAHPKDAVALGATLAAERAITPGHRVATGGARTGSLADIEWADIKTPAALPIIIPQTPSGPLDTEWATGGTSQRHGAPAQTAAMPATPAAPVTRVGAQAPAASASGQMATALVDRRRRTRRIAAIAAAIVVALALAGIVVLALTRSDDAQPAEGSSAFVHRPSVDAAA